MKLRKKEKSILSKGKPSGLEDIAGPEVTDALARELLGVCMATLGRYGVNANRLVELAVGAIDSQGEIPTASKLFQDVDRLGDLANEWTENPAYVDATGRPRTLPIKGAGPTFGNLVRKYFAGRPTNEVLDLGCRTRLLERIGDDRVAQFGGCVMFTGHPMLMLVHAIHSVRWFLATTLSNAGSQPPSTTILPDRRACTAVPEGDLHDFISVMRQPVISLVEMGNRWLSARATMKRPNKGKKIQMGVHAYLFKDPGSFSASTSVDHR